MATQAPYGDIFTVQTPNLQRASNLLYQEQQKREAMGYQDYLATQQQLQKEFANVRQADIPEVIDAYGKYKTAKQSLLFDRKLHRDPKLYAQKQQEANEAYANAMSKINGSIALKGQFDELSKRRLSNPDDFEDNAGTLMVQDMSTPMSKLSEGGWTPERYTYKGANFNFGDAIKAATGTPKTNYLPETLSADKLSFEQKGFSTANNPLQFHDVLSGYLGTKKADKAAAYFYDNSTTPEQKKEIQDKFLALPDDYFVGYGIDPKDVPAFKQRLMQDNAQSKAEAWSILQSQAYALNNPPKLADTKTRVNEAAKQDFELKKLGIEQAFREKMARLESALIEGRQKNNQGDVNNSIDALVDNQITSAKQGVGFGELGALPVDPATLKAMGITKALLSPDGNIIPVYEKDIKQNGQTFTQTWQGTPVTIDQWKAALGKRNIGQKYFQKKVPEIEPLNKSFNIVDPNTGEIILKNVSKEEADKAVQKGYKIN